MKKLLIVFAAAATVGTACKTGKKATTTANTSRDTVATAPPKPADPFQTSPNGLRYLLAEDVQNGRNASVGDFVELHIVTHVGDSVLFDSRKVNNNNPVPLQIQPPSFKGDLVEGFTMMSKGDSAVFLVPVDSLVDKGVQLLPWMQKGAGLNVEYNVRLVSLQSMQERMAAMQAEAEQQKTNDSAMLNAYFAQNKIQAKRTPSGLYYRITRAGKGVKPVPGDSVSMNYTGKTLDGQTFDSNVDPKFQHVQPFWFILGQRQVIPGWDEGIALLPKGTKATLYLPSGLAYGPQSPSPAIPPNSILVFDVEVVNVKKPKAAK